ncbi:MAG: cupin-like domain-containing protein [Acidimicrobiales bacterium]
MTIEPDITVEPDISFEWHRWAAISLLRGTPVSEVIAILVANGVPEASAAMLAGEILSDPTLEAGKWAIGRLYKLESILEVRQQLRDLAGEIDAVPRRSGVSSEQFLTEYYACNLPVLLEDVCHEWPALDRWSPDYLVEQLGDVEVEVMDGRQEGPGDELKMDEQRTRTSFAKYVRRVLATEWSNEFYLVANNGLLASDLAEPLWKDFSLDARYLRPEAPRAETFVWYGPAGTVTNLHHDVMNILFHQVYGWKHVILIAPTNTHRVSNSVGVYSDVDPLAPDLDRFPAFEGVHQLHVTVGPGEALFIPVGWWHHVTALETSISISSTSFCFPNSFKWANPTMGI